MKTLKDHVIVYDDECPMCDLYTRAFVKTKMLDKNGREAYSWLPSALSQQIDKRRARNEIALVNTKTGRVAYGIDSLLQIAGHRFSWLIPLFEFRPLRFILKQLYSFVSYNRRVIIPVKKFEGKNSCTPDFNLGYRITFIVFAWLLVSWILNGYSSLLAPLIPAGNFYRELLICGGQIIFQAMVVALIKKDRLVHYLGNMMAVSLGGALLLLPMVWIGGAGIITSVWFFAFYFLSVAGLMLIEHIRRVKILGISGYTSVTWLFYRLLILIAVL